MKSCYFTSTSKQGRKIQGKVTLKNDGKTSISLFDAKYGTSYSDRYQAKLLANEIVAADFNHPAAREVISDEKRQGLIATLTNETQDLKVAYLASVENWAKKQYAFQLERKDWKHEKWCEVYGTYEAKDPYKSYIFEEGTANIIGHDYKTQTCLNPNGKKAIQTRNSILAKPIEKYVGGELLHAENHYNNSIAKLALRLNQKGVTDDTKLKITKAGLGINLDMTIEHDGTSTRAWTIIASGAIQRPHYRYLVK